MPSSWPRSTCCGTAASAPTSSASAETHADAGDKTNDPIRVNGAELRCRCVGEGGNLGLTQAGRIEYARNGGRINTDFIDNSAGVDTSDHEVNIKILLDRVVAQGDLTGKQRNDLPGVDDRRGFQDLGARRQLRLPEPRAGQRRGERVGTLHVHEDWMRRLERQGLLNRELEFLPSRKQVSQLPRPRPGPDGSRARCSPTPRSCSPTS